MGIIETGSEPGTIDAAPPAGKNVGRYSWEG